MFDWLRRRFAAPTSPVHPSAVQTAQVSATGDFWRATTGPALAQGDFLCDCLIPIFEASLRPGTELQDVEVDKVNLIIVTQSCDLEQNKVQHVALCPIHGLSEFAQGNPGYKKSSRWEEVRKGRVEGLHLLASPTTPTDNRQALVVDFRHIVSLPLEYLRRHAQSLGQRWRLQSPYLEHFSQAFARFFMRVGLPSAIPKYS